MSVDTKIMIPKGKYTVEKAFAIIAKLLDEQLGAVTNEDLLKYHIEVNESYDKDTNKLVYRTGRLHVILNFDNKDYENGKECRTIWCYDDISKQYFNIGFGAWGHNKEMANIIVDYFGGTADYSDCDDIMIDYAKAQRSKS